MPEVLCTNRQLYYEFEITNWVENTLKIILTNVQYYSRSIWISNWYNAQ